MFFRRSLGYSVILLFSSKFDHSSMISGKNGNRTVAFIFVRFFFPYSYHDNVNEFQKMTTKTTGAVTATIYTHAAGTDVTVIL